jgi:hypothetical protein
VGARLSLQVLNNKQLSFQTMVFSGAKQFISDKITKMDLFFYMALNDFDWGKSITRAIGKGGP